MNTVLKLALLVFLMFLYACSDSKDKVAETTKAQSEISSQHQVLAENQNLKARSEEMERDLSARHRFFQGVKGRYEGAFKTKDGEFRIRITLSPNIAPYTFSSYRPFRRLEEVASDLNNLTFNAQIVQWNPANPLSAVSCRVEQIRPDLRIGEIIISGTSCPNLYLIKVTESEDDTYSTASTSEVLAQRLLDGAEDRVDMLVGEIQPSSSADIYKFKAKR